MIICHKSFPNIDARKFKYTLSVLKGNYNLFDFDVSACGKDATIDVFLDFVRDEYGITLTEMDRFVANLPALTQRQRDRQNLERAIEFNKSRNVDGSAHKRTFNRAPGLYPLTGKVKPVKLFGFDTETMNKNKDFLCGSLVGKDYLKYTEDRDELYNELATNQIFRNAFICATNLEFDLGVLFGSVLNISRTFYRIDSGNKLIMATGLVPYRPNGKIYNTDNYVDSGLKRNELYKITFIDSLAHFPASVETLGKFIGIPKLPHPSFLGDKWSNESERSEMKAYNINDSSITFSYMTWLQDQYNALGANLKPTSSAVSMDLFRREYLGRAWRQQPRDMIMDSYAAFSGGRVEAFKRGEFLAENYGKIFAYDKNSLYPSCLLKYKYPVMADYYRAEKVTADMVDSFMGSAHFELNAPVDMNIPIIGMKTDKFRFMVGHIKGYYDFNTISKALDNGYELISGKDGIIYENSHRPFRGIIESLYSKRLQYQQEGNPAEQAVKLLMNSLFGKFGFKPQGKEQLMATEDACGYWMSHSVIPVGPDICRVIADKATCKIPGYVFPIISAYTTSYARAEMWDLMRSIGFLNMIYTDTDSAFTTRKMPTSTALGDIKLEGEFERLIIIKPKMYAADLGDGMAKIKVKGVHDKFLGYDSFRDRILNCKSLDVTSNHFMRSRGSLHGADKYINMPFTMSKSLDLNDDKRSWSMNKFTFEPQDSAPMICKNL